MSRPKTRGASGFVLLVLALAAWAGAERSRRTFFTTLDEPIHVAAARELRFGYGLVSNVEHPVLMKAIAAAGIRRDAPPRQVDEIRDGRRLFPFVFALLVVTTAFWSLRRAGLACATAAGALLFVDPTCRGHAGLATNDILVTLFFMAAALALDEATRAKAARPLLLGLSGVAFGFAMLTKFSAIPFLALFLLVVAALFRSLVRAPALVLVPALVTLLAGETLATARTTRLALEQGIERNLAAFPETAAWQRAIHGLPKGAEAYAAGLGYVRASSVPGRRLNYLFGRLSSRGHPLYFAVALFVKMTAAVVLGALALLVAWGLRLARSPRTRRRREVRLLLARAGLPALLAFLFLAAASFANLNIGVRHAIPVVPLGLVAAGGATRTLFRRRRRLGVALLATVVVASGVEAGARLGREISFGNVLIGGPPRVHEILSDSNVDWGQEQELVFERASRGLGRVVMAAVAMDEAEAVRRGVTPYGMNQPPKWDPASGTFDSVVISRFVLDTAHAFERKKDLHPFERSIAGFVVPFVNRIESRARSSEPLGDAYVLFRYDRRN